MGDIFSLGFGPFRWVCSSGDKADLAITDRLALEVMEALLPDAHPSVREQLLDNIRWIQGAMAAELVVGSTARILYSNREGRANLALAFNSAVRDGVLSAPVIMSRDHHDVSGTDSPYRETSDIYDGSQFTADMAVHNAIGDSFRGATWVALHNGGGVGWGEVINGGFGLVLDGSAGAARRAAQMLHWDVNNGISRRAWAGNANANLAIRHEMEQGGGLVVTLANKADDALLEGATLAALGQKAKL
jgi:urocanate hydratase